MKLYKLVHSGDISRREVSHLFKLIRIKLLNEGAFTPNLLGLTFARAVGFI